MLLRVKDDEDVLLLRLKGETAQKAFQYLKTLKPQNLYYLFCYKVTPKSKNLSNFDPLF